MRILRILMILMSFALGIVGHLKGAEGALRSENRTVESGFGALSENEVEEVKRIWRAIGDQEIVKWDGREWLAKTEAEKKEVIKKACEAWRKAGYQKIKSVDYFVEDIDKYYNHHRQKDPEKGLETKAGLVMSLSAFFSGLRSLNVP